MVVIPLVLVLFDLGIELNAVAVYEIVDRGSPARRLHEVHDHIQHPILLDCGITTSV